MTVTKLEPYFTLSNSKTILDEIHFTTILLANCAPKTSANDTANKPRGAQRKPPTHRTLQPKKSSSPTATTRQVSSPLAHQDYGFKIFFHLGAYRAAGKPEAPRSKISLYQNVYYRAERGNKRYARRPICPRRGGRRKTSATS